MGDTIVQLFRFLASGVIAAPRVASKKTGNDGSA